MPFSAIRSFLSAGLGLFSSTNLVRPVASLQGMVSPITEGYCTPPLHQVDCSEKALVEENSRGSLFEATDKSFPVADPSVWRYKELYKMGNGSTFPKRGLGSQIPIISRTPSQIQFAASNFEFHDLKDVCLVNLFPLRRNPSTAFNMPIMSLPERSHLQIAGNDTMLPSTSYQKMVNKTTAEQTDLPLVPIRLAADEAILPIAEHVADNPADAANELLTFVLKCDLGWGFYEFWVTISEKQLLGLANYFFELSKTSNPSDCGIPMIYLDLYLDTAADRPTLPLMLTDPGLTPTELSLAPGMVAPLQIRNVAEVVINQLLRFAKDRNVLDLSLISDRASSAQNVEPLAIEDNPDFVSKITGIEPLDLVDIGSDDRAEHPIRPIGLNGITLVPTDEVIAIPPFGISPMARMPFPNLSHLLSDSRRVEGSEIAEHKQIAIDPKASEDDLPLATDLTTKEEIYGDNLPSTELISRMPQEKEEKRRDENTHEEERDSEEKVKRLRYEDGDPENGNKPSAEAKGRKKKNDVAKVALDDQDSTSGQSAAELSIWSFAWFRMQLWRILKQITSIVAKLLDMVKNLWEKV